MYKKFVPLNSIQSPTKNPYEVRTFMGEPLKSQHPEWRSENCGYERECETPQNSTIAKVLTLEDEIRKIHKKTEENIFARRCRRKCKYDDNFLTCVVPQRSPQELKRHAVLREKYLKVKKDMGEYVHDMDDIYSDHPSLVKLHSPLGSDAEDEEEEDGDDDEVVKPDIASPECSLEMIYVPTPRILEVKRPKSGVYINESEPPYFHPTDEIPYSTYNPRVLQEQFDAQNLKKIDMIPGKTIKDLWTWNLGLQQRESELDRRFIEAAVPKFDCDKIELTIYQIPKDLEKTFSAGIVFGTKAVKLDPEPKRRTSIILHNFVCSSSNRPKEVACLYVAYVEGFRLNADFWTAETMDNIIKMGEKLTAKSQKLNYTGKNNDFDVIPQIFERQAEVGLKIHFSGPLKSEPNIYKALSLYFSKYNACILCSKRLYLLIWKRCKNFYYIYDPNGRGKNCERNFANGKCALMSTHFVEHLVHLIVNISHTNMDDEFHLYEIYLASYGKIPESLPKKPFPKRFHKIWTVINDSFAVIPGCNNGLFQPNSAAVHNPSMLISVMAILYAQIERANTWNPDAVDELVRLGTAYYKSLRRKLKLKDNQHVVINDLPEKYVLGTYKASLKKTPFFYTGTVTDYCKKFVNSLLTCGLNELFNGKLEAALLQIDNSIVGIWRDSELFYLYDPFRRGKAGQVLDPDDYLSKGTAVLQMHANFESFLRVLHQKALRMRRGGKFFLHAIKVGCIKPIMDGKQRKLRYPKLKLTPETYLMGSGKKDEEAGGDKPDIIGGNVGEAEEGGKKDKKSKKTRKGQKGAKDKKKLEKVCSIESLKSEERIPSFDNSDIVEGVVDDFITDLVSALPEPTIARPKLYKSADRVLLRSDQQYLEQLKYMVQHDQDYDNVNLAFLTEPEPETPPITLEEELAVPSNFQNLPDGTWIIFGSKIMPRLDDDQTKLKGLLSAIVTASMTGRYKISTWNRSLIDYAVNSTDSFGEDFQTYQYALGALLAKKMPTLSLGTKTYNIKIQNIIKSDLQKPLRQALLENLVDYNRLLVICQRFSCLIIKRYNFLYMFIGFPVNTVGYRKSNRGPACLLRFVELDALIRRIEFGCNPHGCDITNYVVIPLKVVDVTPESAGRYRQWKGKLESRMYKDALEEQRRRRKSKISKMRFLQSEMHKESERIDRFRQDKDEVMKTNRIARSKSGAKVVFRSEEESGTGLSDRGNYDDENVEEVEEDYHELPQPKHKIGTKIPKARNEYLRPQPILYGYRMREKDNRYKIQGSKALEGREECVLDEIKPCFFASALAILYAILKPHSQWTSQRVDQVIDSALILCDSIEDLSTSFERIIKNVSVDDYTFDIWIKSFDPIGLIGDLGKQIERATSLRKYLIMHTANCAYAIYKDEYYHLFDSYASMHVLDNVPMDEEEEGEEEEHRRNRAKYLRGIKRYGERNTASWVLFADIKSMVRYMDQRGCSPTWKEEWEYTFQVVDIISYKKSPQHSHVLQLLTGMAPCHVTGVEEAAICAHNETIAWLEHCLPVWSRLNRRNAAGLYRGMAVSKFKKFDVEIYQRLWSLWGNIHPQAPVFDQESKGKQYLACCVMALCAARLYRLVDWSPQLLDSIIINGNRYHQQSIADIRIPDYEMRLEDLEVECNLDNAKFLIHIEPVCYGKLYCRPYFNRMNLAEALMYFFNTYQFGILQCFKKCLAIGYVSGQDGGYFMFDCQSRDHPLFPKGQGAAYVLRTKYLQILLYCIVVTLNIPYYNAQFTLHKIDTLPENTSVDDGTAASGGRNH